MPSELPEGKPDLEKEKLKKTGNEEKKNISEFYVRQNNFSSAIRSGNNFSLSSEDLLPDNFEEINQECEIASINDLIAVRKSVIFPWNDTISPGQNPQIIFKRRYPSNENGQEYQFCHKAKYTFFTLNSHVVDHKWGNFSNCKYAILIFLKDIPKEQIIWGNPVDFAVEGDIICQNQYFIICPEDDKNNFSNIMNNKKAVVIGYKDIDLDSAINTVIAYLGFKLEYGYIGENYYKLKGDDDIKIIAPILDEYGIEPHINASENCKKPLDNGNFSNSIYAYGIVIEDNLRTVIALIKQCKPSNIDINEMLLSIRKFPGAYCYPCDKAIFIDVVKSVLDEYGYTIPEGFFDSMSNDETFTLDFGNEKHNSFFSNYFLRTYGKSYYELIKERVNMPNEAVYWHNFYVDGENTYSIYAAPQWQIEMREKVIEYIFEREKEMEVQREDKKANKES